MPSRSKFPLKLPAEGQWKRLRFLPGDGIHQGPALRGRPWHQHRLATLVMVACLIMTGFLALVLVLIEVSDPGAFSGRANDPLSRWLGALLLIVLVSSFLLIPTSLIAVVSLGRYDQIAVDPDLDRVLAQRRWWFMKLAEIEVSLRHARISSTAQVWQESRYKTDIFDWLLFPFGPLGWLIGSLRRRKEVPGKLIHGRQLALDDGESIVVVMTTMDPKPADAFVAELRGQISRYHPGFNQTDLSTSPR